MASQVSTYRNTVQMTSGNLQFNTPTKQKNHTHNT